MTKQECAIISAFTGVNMLKGDDLKYLYNYVSELIGRPVFTHEMGIIGSERLKDLSRSDFIDLCRTATDGEKKEKDEKKEEKKPDIGFVYGPQFDPKYLTKGRMFILEQWKVKVPSKEGDKFVPIQLKASYPCWVDELSNGNLNVTVTYLSSSTNEFNKTNISVSDVLHGLFKFIPAKVCAEVEDNG
jgi:hypothetical protein